MTSEERMRPHGAAGCTVHRRDLVVPDGLELPRLVEMVPGATQEVLDEAVTFRQVQHDTADLRLARWGAELRVRLDGPDPGWRLVLPPQDGDDRDVVCADLAGPDQGGQAPAELLDLVRALVREGVVLPVAQVRTTRSTLHLVDSTGRELAVVHDDRVQTTVGPDVERRQRRVRITAPGPSPDAERAVTRLVDTVQAAVVARVGLAAAAPTPADAVEAGAGAAQGTLAEGAADVVVPRRPRRHSPAGDVLAYTLAVQVRAFLLADVAVRRDRPDAVHRLRVAARTLRSALRTFSPLCDEAWTVHLRDQLAVAADALGAVRDTEVLYARLEAHAERLDPADRVRVLPALDELLRPRLLDARAAALEELRSARYLQLLLDLVDAARHPRLSGARSGAAAKDAVDVLPQLVTRDWLRLRRAARRLRTGHLDPRDAAWHRARILAKRARYGAEAAAPSLGRPARRWAEQMSAVTDLLGELHDGVVATQVLQQAAAGVDGPTGLALGRLLALEDAAVDAAGAQLLDRWPRLRRRLDRHALG